MFMIFLELKGWWNAKASDQPVGDGVEINKHEGSNNMEKSVVRMLEICSN
jgi:hypothetical protein